MCTERCRVPVPHGFVLGARHQGVVRCRCDATRRSKVMPRWMFIVLEFKGEGRLLWLMAAVPALSVRAGRVAMEVESGRLVRWGIRPEVLATVVCCAGMV